MPARRSSTTARCPRKPRNIFSRHPSTDVIVDVRDNILPARTIPSTILRDTLCECNSLIVVRRRVETVPEVQLAIGLQYHRLLHLDIATMIDCHKTLSSALSQPPLYNRHRRTFQ